MDQFELRFCGTEPALAEMAARMWLDELAASSLNDPNPNRVPAHHDSEPEPFLGAPASLPANVPPAGMPALPGKVQGETSFDSRIHRDRGLASAVGRDSVEPRNLGDQKSQGSTESHPTQVRGMPPRLQAAQWDHEPTPGPSQEGSFAAGAGGQFPSSEGCRGGSVHGKSREFYVALSGGRITSQFFSAVVAESSRRSGSWDRVHFFWADERCVAPEHPESNFATAKRYLLDPLKIALEKVHRIRAELGEEAAAIEAADELRRTVPSNPQGVPVLDLIFLGMGEDGHVASLFPDEPEERIASPPLYRSVRAPKPPPSRITLTYSVIAAARQVWVLASGAGKETSLRESVSPTGKTPLARVLSMRRKTLILTEINL